MGNRVWACVYFALMVEGMLVAVDSFIERNPVGIVLMSLIATICGAVFMWYFLSVLKPRGLQE